MNKILKSIKEKSVQIIKFIIHLFCNILLSLMYLPYIVSLFCLLAFLFPVAIVLLFFIFAENYLKKKKENDKQKARDHLYKRFENDEINEDELEYELEFF